MTAGYAQGSRGPHKMDSALSVPFSEWPQVFPNARLCKAMLDRLTDRAHIIETGTESFRFRRTIAGKRMGKGPANVSEGRASPSP